MKSTTLPSSARLASTALPLSIPHASFLARRLSPARRVSDRGLPTPRRRPGLSRPLVAPSPTDPTFQTSPSHFTSGHTSPRRLPVSAHRSSPRPGSQPTIQFPRPPSAPPRPIPTSLVSSPLSPSVHRNASPPTPCRRHNATRHSPLLTSPTSRPNTRLSSSPQFGSTSRLTAALVVSRASTLVAAARSAPYRLHAPCYPTSLHNATDPSIPIRLAYPPRLVAPPIPSPPSNPTTPHCPSRLRPALPVSAPFAPNRLSPSTRSSVPQPCPAIPSRLIPTDPFALTCPRTSPHPSSAHADGPFLIPPAQYPQIIPLRHSTGKALT